MPYSATVFNVLIASPSDVPAERQAIAESLHEWNSLHSENTSKILLPVMWESHSAPSMGDRPQGIINDLVVKSCDMLIGAFWTRLGSPTGLEESGTVEEIKWFLKHKKPVMLYYSDAPVQPSKIDKNQLDKLEDFKKSIRKQGIQEDYSSVEELKTKLSRQLTIVLRGMSVGTVVAASVVKEAKASTAEPIAPTASTAPAAPAAPTAPTARVPRAKRTASVAASNPAKKTLLEDYSDKSFVVRGDTKSLKDELKALGGNWIKTREGTFAWNFSKKRIDDVAQLLGVKPELNS